MPETLPEVPFSQIKLYGEFYERSGDWLWTKETQEELGGWAVCSVDYRGSFSNSQMVRPRRADDVLQQAAPEPQGGEPHAR